MRVLRERRSSGGWVRWSLAVVLGLCGWSGLAAAGPNLGGTLVVHDPGIAYTDESIVFPSPAPANCGAVDAELPLAPPTFGFGWVWKVYAAFPPGSSPRLKALAFGATWQTSEIRVIQGGVPDPVWDFELPQDGWPTLPGTGVGVSFAVVKTAAINEVYWLGGYAYQPGVWSLAGHPTQEPIFVDDDSPPAEDPIAAMSTIGFGQPGETFCPVVLGGCCFEGGGCVVLPEAECTAQGGVQWAGYADCDPYPCTILPGACCLSNGTCQMVNQFSCSALGGDFMGQGVPCSPNPCPEASGACCYPTGICLVRPESICFAEGGGYQGHGTACVPNPCPQPATGACCFSSGICVMMTAAQCLQYGGEYQGDGAVCIPNPCPQPPASGACCYPNGQCQVRTEASCASSGGLYLGDGTVCIPNPCAQPTGACCEPSGTCELLSASACQAAGGVWLGSDAPCIPDPCAGLTGACCSYLGECVVSPYLECSGYFMPGEGCDPNPCPPGGGTGACCLYWGGCLILDEQTCYGSGGWMWMEGFPCDPNPCDTVPIEGLSWGKLKHRFQAK